MNGFQHGVEIAGTGMAVPEQVLTNHDLEQMMDTSDEWIVQRTGVKTRYRSDRAKGENVTTMSTRALSRALEDAHMTPNDLDLIIVATCTGDTNCPSVAARVSESLGAAPAGAFDMVAACSGFVYGLNTCDSLLRAGPYKTIGLVGADSLTSIADYTNRRVSILSGDGAGAAVLRKCDQPERGCLFQSMYCDGGMWDYLYVPHRESDAPDDVDWNEAKMHCLQMKGREVFKFAVTKFPEALEEALTKSGVGIDDIRMIVAHQSNARIIEATRRRLGMSEDRFYVNIDRYGNTSAGSVPICFDELRKAGRIEAGDIVAFVAMGAGMTWGASLWRL